MAEFEMSPMDESRMFSARRQYMQPGPDFPAQEKSLFDLEDADKTLSQVAVPEAQELRGWVNIDRIFHYPKEQDAEQREAVMDSARQAFGWAYDMYGEIGYDFRRARLQVIAGSLSLYECWATGRPVDDTIRQTALEAWSRAGVALVECGGVKQEQKIQARTEAVLLMARMAIRGNTRKPMAAIAVPATFRQRIGHSPRDVEERRGRYNWDVSLLKYHPKEGAWDLQGGIRVKTDYDQGEGLPLHEDILVVSQQDVVGAPGLNAVNDTLRLFSEVFTPTTGSVDADQRQQVTTLSRGLERRIREHNFNDFAAGND